MKRFRPNHPLRLKRWVLIFSLMLLMVHVQAQQTVTKTDTARKDTTNLEKTLKEVSIKGRKKMIERKIDRTVVNVAGFITAAGTDAFDLMGRLPGLRITDDGAINLMGKGANILVDGKSTYLSGAELAAYLKSIPTDLLDKIELMPNPPAKYDAAGSGGLINIITKKNKQQGYNAGMSVNGGYGVYRKVNGSVNFNYRVNKLNLFLNAGAAAPKDFENSTGTRRFDAVSGQPYAILDQSGEIRYTRQNSNVKIGADYYLNKKTTFGFIVNSTRGDVKERGANTNLMKNGFNLLDSTVYSNNNVDNNFYNNMVNLNMVHQFDTLGRELGVDVDYARFGSQSDQLFANSTYNAGNVFVSDELSRGDLPRTIDILAAKADYSMPLLDWKLNMGLKVSQVSTDNRANYFRGAGGNEVDLNRTNAFLYRENINAVYTDAYREFGRLGVKLGLRVEQTNAKGHQLGNALHPDSAFTRTYLNAFPSLFLSYKPDSTNVHQWFFSYGRRIGRPGYDRLNPFLSLVQRYNQEAGNPFLRPEFTHNFELTNVYKDQLNTNIYYSALSNITTQLITPVGDVYVKKPVNTGNTYIAGAMITYNKDLFKWWNADFSVNPERVQLDVQLNDKKVDTAFFAYSFNWFNRFTLGKNCSAELVLNWGGPSYSGQNTTKGMAALRAGIKQTLFKGNGSIGLSGSDLFYSAVTRGRLLNIAGSAATYRSRKDSRSVMLAFSYRISRNAKENRRLRDRNGAREEQGRVNSSY